MNKIQDNLVQAQLSHIQFLIAPHNESWIYLNSTLFSYIYIYIKKQTNR